MLMFLLFPAAFWTMEHTRRDHRFKTVSNYCARTQTCMGGCVEEYSWYACAQAVSWDNDMSISSPHRVEHHDRAHVIHSAARAWRSSPEVRPSPRCQLRLHARYTQQMHLILTESGCVCVPQVLAKGDHTYSAFDKLAMHDDSVC